MKEFYGSPHDCPCVENYWLDRIVVRPAPILSGVLLLGPCWIWQGWNNAKPYNKNGTGGPYGKVKIKGRGEYLHRIMWERHNGVLLQGGEVIDHLCRVRLCFSPYHVENTNAAENARRREEYAAKFRASEFTPEYEAEILEGLTL